MLIVESDTEQVDQIQDRLGIGYTRRGGVIYGIWGETETGQREKGNDAADTGGAAVCDQTDRFPVGEWSFPNKRILRNNLCLPACRILMYKRMALEI